MANSKNDGNSKDTQTNLDRVSERTNSSSSTTSRRNAKRNKRRKRSDASVNITKTKSSPANDVSWYTLNPQLLSDVASLPFAEPLGKPVSLGSNRISGEDTDFNVTTPGVLTIKYMNHIGDSGTAASAINIAATSIYSYVRHENSGHANYDAADLMIYLIAMDNIYSAISYLRRVYATALSYSVKNRYYPRVLLEAMGVNFDDVFANLANLRAQINMLSIKASTLCVPNTMKYFTRHTWLCENIYTDAPLLKSQSYIFVPDGWYEFQIDPQTSKGELKFVPRRDTLQNIITQINEMINSMLEQEDFGIMSGDILKAYGSSSLFTFNPLTDNATIVPVYSPEVLAQIHNAVSITQSVADTRDFNIGNITQTDDGLITQKIVYGPNTETPPSDIDSIRDAFYFGLENFIIDLPLEHPTAADVMVATRLTSMIVRNDTIDTVSAASELVTGFTSYKFTDSGTISDDDVTSLNVIDISGKSSVYDELQVQRDWHRFAQAPLLYRLFVDVSSSSPMIYPTFSISGDLDNYTSISFNTLQRINETAMLSLFDVGMRYRS